MSGVTERACCFGRRVTGHTVEFHLLLFSIFLCPAAHQTDAHKPHLNRPPEPAPDPFISASTGYWQDASVDRSNDAGWKATAPGCAAHPAGIRKILNYVQVGGCGRCVRLG